jgi:hypothetical protein
MMDANLNALVDRTTMRCSIVESGTHNKVRILESPITHGEPLHLMTVERHWMKIRDDPRDDLAPTLTKSGI